MRIRWRDEPALGDFFSKRRFLHQKTGLNFRPEKFWSATRSRPVSGPGGSEAQSAKMSGEPDRLWDRNLRAPVCGTGDPMWDLEEISNQKRGGNIVDP